MSLITPEDLALKLRADVDLDQALQVCELVTGMVQAVTGQTLTLADHVDVVEVSPATLPRIKWPTGHSLASWPTIVGHTVLHELPVSDVSAVATFGDDLNADAWWWDGLSPEVWLADPETPTATITYEAGWDPVPPALKAAALAIAAGEYTNPTGLKSEQIGDYAATFGAAGGPGIDGSVAKILARYTRRTGTITPA